MYDHRHRLKILKEYEKQGDEIVRHMFQVLMRAQLKVDNAAYRKKIEEFQRGIK